MGVLLTGTGAGSGEAALTADTELELVLVLTGAGPGPALPTPATPPLLELRLPLLLPLFLAETLLSSDWLLRCLLFRSSWWLWLWLAVWPSTGLLPDTELVLLAVSLASTLCGSGAPI